MRMLVLVMTALCAGSAAAWGQELESPAVDYPALPATAASPQGFVPEGWRLEYQRSGDLDKDQRDDVVLVLRMQRPSNIVQDGGTGGREFDTNPRMLAVAFAGDSGYRLAVQDHELIPRPDPSMEDYLGSDDALHVRRGAFTVRLDAFSSAGSWSTSNRTFTFRHQDGCFRLIGYDSVDLHRGSGETSEVSINYAAGKANFERGSIESDDPHETRSVAVPREPLPCLQTIGNGLEFDPGVASPFSE